MDLRELDEALVSFAVFNPTSFPVHHAQVFLLVATRGRVTYREIEETLNLSNSTVSRTVNAMGDTHRKGYPGHGLLEVYRDPGKHQRFMVRLTAKGKALLRQLEAL
jgi:DNA-binding MarR family transcriptional regulator